MCIRRRYVRSAAAPEYSPASSLPSRSPSSSSRASSPHYRVHVQRLSPLAPAPRPPASSPSPFSASASSSQPLTASPSPSSSPASVLELLPPVSDPSLAVTYLEVRNGHSAAYLNSRRSSLRPPHVVALVRQDPTVISPCHCSARSRLLSLAHTCLSRPTLCSRSSATHLSPRRTRRCSRASRYARAHPSTCTQPRARWLVLVDSGT